VTAPLRHFRLFRVPGRTPENPKIGVRDPENRGFRGGPGQTPELGGRTPELALFDPKRALFGGLDPFFGGGGPRNWGVGPRNWGVGPENGTFKGFSGVPWGKTGVFGVFGASRHLGKALHEVPKS
jgi:hypothetical protein